MYNNCLLTGRKLYQIKACIYQRHFLLYITNYVKPVASHICVNSFCATSCAMGVKGNTHGRTPQKRMISLSWRGGQIYFVVLKHILLYKMFKLV